ncbi:class I SAM-dependent methyltransferase [Marinomonas atlantica]|uniref:thiopurine S-methyltransferase n=1 Tax=Marinomonas atlantica TaxID=1806668 RepID=UPI0009ED48AE|nr:thiopurine S-methyltransferase [Marinomonas atlantica]
MVTNEFWLERWQMGRIGFHRDEVNPWLIQYWPQIGRGAKVLVPLCGKSADLLWLANQGYDVTGVELSPMAVVEFFGDNDLTYQTEQVGSLKIHTAHGLALRIVEGDYFDFHETGFDACYDRAALVAIPEDKREQYVLHTKQRLTPEATLLLITLSYDGDQAGPPFSVLDFEVNELWGDWIRKLASEDLLQLDERYQGHDRTFYEESVWRITA